MMTGCFVVVVRNIVTNKTISRVECGCEEVADKYVAALTELSGGKHKIEKCVRKGGIEITV